MCDNNMISCEAAEDDGFDCEEYLPARARGLLKNRKK